MSLKDEKLTDENPSPLFQINKMQSRIRCWHLQDKINASARKKDTEYLITVILYTDIGLLLVQHVRPIMLE